MKLPSTFEHLGKNIVMVLSLLAAGFFVAWLRYQPHLGRTGQFTDGERQYESSAEAPIRYAVWEEAQRLAGALEEGEAEHRPAISPDGRWLVFVSGERGANSDLWIAELRDGKAELPRSLFELNSTYDELSPAFSDKGLYFASNREGIGGFDLWYAEQTNFGEFAAPLLLDKSINTARDELDPAPLPEGGGLAFSSNRNMAGRRGHDFYLALPGTDESYTVEPLESLNSWFDDRELSFTRDGRRAFFSSNRGETEQEQREHYDLFASLHDFGSWLKPQAVDGLNTPANERGPAPDHNGFELYFEREQAPLLGDDFSRSDLFRASTLEIFQRPGPRVGWLDFLILVALLVMALLAFLAKRWDAIEVLYKCFLVSLLAHGAMLYWFRDIHPEAEPTELHELAPAYRVKLVPSNRASAAAAERGGALNPVQKREEEADNTAEPERLDQRPQASLSESIPAHVELVRAQSPSPALQRSAQDWQPAESKPAQAALLSDAPTVQLAALNASAANQLSLPSVLPPSASASSEQRSTREGTPSKRSRDREEASALHPQGRQLARKSQNEAAAHAGTPDLLMVSERSDILPSSIQQDDLRGPQDSEQGAQSKRSLALGQDSQALPQASVLNAASRRGSGAQGEIPERQQRAGRSPQNTWVEPQPLAMETRPQLRSTEALKPEKQVWQPDHTGNLPSAPLVMAAIKTPVRRSLSRTERNEQEVPFSMGSSMPQPTRLSTRARTSQPASPSKRAISRSTDKTPVIKPSLAKVNPDQRLLPVAVPEQEVAKFEHTPYRTRFGPAKARALEEHGGSEETEAAVANGLAYLAGIQKANGSWGPANYLHDKYGEVRVGKTGLCLLAFLGAGHTPDSGTEYSGATEAAIRFLLSRQNERTGHFGRSSSYSHGIATYALAESFALTSAKPLRRPIEQAVAEILRYQHDTPGDSRRFGGWGYYGNGSTRADGWPRASITAWQVMALESARLGGLEVPDSAFTNARQFLAGCLDERRGAFRYSHEPSRLRGAYPILPGSTPASLFVLSLLGVNLESPSLEDSWEFLSQRAPSEYRYRGVDAFVHQAQGNLYFWYYGSLASMRRGGTTWKRWNIRLQDALLNSQRDDGSWQPISTYAKDYARDTRNDASYSTAMNVLSLEVYYRYFTPLLKVGR